jgi:hypothetical protein
MLKYARLTNVFQNLKSLARHQNFPSTPSPFSKPVNPWDNIDPGRTNKELIDEYDLYY